MLIIYIGNAIISTLVFGLSVWNYRDQDPRLSSAAIVGVFATANMFYSLAVVFIGFLK